MDRVRHLPRGEDGREAVFITTEGGMLDVLADTLEEHIIAVARQDAARAAHLATDDAVSRAELKVALRFAASTIRRLTEIAEDHVLGGTRPGQAEPGARTGFAHQGHRPRCAPPAGELVPT